MERYNAPVRYPNIQRRPTRAIRVGKVQIGGGIGESEIAPVALQSMTNTATADVDATCAQIGRLVEAGADLVRVAAATPDDTAGLADIVRRSAVPIIADVHFHFQRALEAIAAGVSKVRLNPGNISDRDQVRRVIHAAGEAGVAIRVGVNEGSLEDVRGESPRPADLLVPLEQRMVAKMEEYLEIFEPEGFTSLVLSAKSHDPYTTVAVNRALAERWDYPLHLGVTHAGPRSTAVIRSAAALGALLSEGIGETIRLSYAGDPAAEIYDGRELLESLGLRRREGVELIACPTCGRLAMDLQPVLEAVQKAIREDRVLRSLARPITVAIMGCVVNGPGEAEGADLALCAGAGKAMLYRRGEKLGTVTTDQIVPRLLQELRDLAEEKGECV